MSAIAEAARARHAHAVALAGPMLGIKMVGDPFIGKCKVLDRLMARRACQYASAILGKDPQFSGGLGHLYAAWDGHSNVIFYSAMREPAGDGSGMPTVWGVRLTNMIEVARVTLPEHVPAFDAAARVTAMRDAQGAA